MRAKKGPLLEMVNGSWPPGKSRESSAPTISESQRPPSKYFDAPLGYKLTLLSSATSGQEVSELSVVCERAKICRDIKVD